MCNCNKSGSTNLLALIPIQTGTASATSNSYFVSLLHYLCGNRKVCINSSTPISATLNYNLQGIEFVGTNLYSATILVSGMVTYLPYLPNCYNVCLKSENILCQVTIPCYSATGVPTVAIAGNGNNVTPTNVRDCCLITNAVEIESEITLTITPPTEA